MRFSMTNNHVSGGRFIPSRFVRNCTVLSVLMLLLTCLPSAWCQRITASLNGTVKDTNGAVIPNASVSLTNTGTNVVSHAQTNGEGAFEINNLSPGPYSV